MLHIAPMVANQEDNTGTEKSLRTATRYAEEARLYKDLIT